MTELDVPEEWQESSEPGNYRRQEDVENRFQPREHFEEKPALQVCPECGFPEYGPISCSSCGYSRITGGKI